MDGVAGLADTDAQLDLASLPIDVPSDGDMVLSDSDATEHDVGPAGAADDDADSDTEASDDAAEPHAARTASLERDLDAMYERYRERTQKRSDAGSERSKGKAKIAKSKVRVESVPAAGRRLTVLVAPACRAGRERGARATGGASRKGGRTTPRHVSAPAKRLVGRRGNRGSRRGAIGPCITGRRRGGRCTPAARRSKHR